MSPGEPRHHPPPSWKGAAVRPTNAAIAANVALSLLVMAGEARTLGRPPPGCWRCWQAARPLSSPGSRHLSHQEAPCQPPPQRAPGGTHPEGCLTGSSQLRKDNEMSDVIAPHAFLNMASISQTILSKIVAAKQARGSPPHKESQPLASFRTR